MNDRSRAWLIVLVVSAVILRSGGAHGEELAPSDDPAVAARSACATLSLSLSRAPALGQRADLLLALESHADDETARVRLELPRALILDPLPQGWRRAESGTASEGDSLEAEIDLRSTRASLHALSLLAVEDGAEWIFAEILEPGCGRDGASDDLPVTIGLTERDSFLGHRIPRVPGSAGRDDWRVELEAPESGSAMKKETPASGEACIEGRAMHREGSPYVASRRVRVQVWDYDLNSPADLLAQVRTDDNGDFSVCFDNHDDETPLSDVDPHPNPDGQDPFLVVVADGPNWLVASGLLGPAYRYAMPDQDQPYCECQDAELGMPLYEDIGDVLQSLPPEQVRPPKSSGVHPAFLLSNIIHRGWAWARTDGTGGQWGAAGTGSVRVRWSSELPQFFDYSPALTTIDVPSHVALLVGSAPLAVLHQLGHFFQDLVGQAAVADPVQCEKFSLNELFSVSPTCSWREGTANWLAVRILGAKDRTIQRLDELNWFRGLRPTDLKDPYEFLTSTWGSRIQENVASFLLDAGDLIEKERPWDRLAIDPTEIAGAPQAGALWLRWATHPASTLNQFVDGWLADLGGDPSQTLDVVSTLYGSCIELPHLPFRDPLTDQVPLRRPGAIYPQTFSVPKPSRERWSVVGIRGGPKQLLLLGSPAEAPVGVPAGQDTDSTYFPISVWAQSAPLSSTSLTRRQWIAFRSAPGRETGVVARAQIPPPYDQMYATRNHTPDWMDYDIELDEGRFVSTGGTPIHFLDTSGAPRSFIRVLTVHGLSQERPLGVALESSTSSGADPLSLFVTPPSVDNVATYDDVLVGAQDASSALAPPGLDRRSVILDTAASNSIGVVVTRRSGDFVNLVAEGGHLWIDQTPPDLSGHPPSALIAALFIPRATVSFSYDSDPETDIHAVRVAVDRNAIAGSAWIGRHRPANPFADAAWTDTCFFAVSEGSTIDYPCTQPTLDVSKLVQPFVNGGAQSVELHVQAMNRAGLISDVVTVQAPVVHP